MIRLVIAGVPRAGKTTCSGIARVALGGDIVPLRHTDDLISPMISWSAASAIVANDWLNRDGPWIVEGVAAVRALRKWLAACPEGMPCDRLIWLDAPRVALTPRQASMAKGCRTVWREIEAEIVARGVHVERA